MIPTGPTLRPKGPFRFTVSPEDCRLRLDQLIAERVQEISRTLARRLVDLGGVHVEGRRVRRCSHVLRAGETVEIYLDEGPLDPFRLGEKDILFRDRFILALSKPAGVETQPTPARYKGTLYEALLTYLKDPFRPLDIPELGMVQRLDRETSGVLVFSVHSRSHGPLTRALAGREVRKIYLALVRGRPAEPEGEIRSFLARRRGTNRMVSTQHGGREAITRYRLVESFADASLLEVEILTGRSHQIRVHMAEAGHPLVGDRLYGGPGSAGGRPVGRQMLHSWRLEIRHPVTDESLLFEAPVPEDMQEILSHLRSPLEPVAPGGRL